MKFSRAGVTLIFTAFMASNLSCQQRVANNDPVTESFLQFLDWNGVPSEVYIGLFSKNDSTVPKHERIINGTCFGYDPTKASRCKFYSDCCATAPSRPLEQLAFGTFSCHHGYYIVDKCPSTTEDQDLKRKCEHMTNQTGTVTYM